MINLLKMDLRRLFQGKMLYIMLAILTVVTCSSVLMVPATGNMVALFRATEKMDFLASNTGIGIIYMILGIMTTMFICNDYSSGFAKNVFSIHANKVDYIVSKIVTMMVAAGVLILVFTIEAFIITGILGRTMGIESVIGFILFLYQKWLAAAMFIAISVFVSLLTRNKGVGCIMAFLIGSGGLVIGLELLFGMLGINGSLILDATVFGTAQLPQMSATPLSVMRVLMVTAFWIIVYGFLGQKVLKSKDV